MRPAAEARGIQLHGEIEPITQPVHGDGARLQQILWNLTKPVEPSELLATVASLSGKFRN